MPLNVNGKLPGRAGEIKSLTVEGIAMRKAILMMLLAVMSSSAVAGLVEFGDTEDSNVYADPSTIHREGNRVKMWILEDYTTPKMDEILGPFISVKRQDELDCKEEQSRTLYISFHSENMGEGEVVGIDETLGKWTPVIPESVGETQWKIACGK